MKLHKLIHFNLKADVPFFQINGFTFFSSVMYVWDNHISWHYYALDIAQRCSSIFILQQFSKDFCQSRSGQRISMSTPKDSRCQNEDLPHSVVFKKRISEEGYLLLPSNLMILKKWSKWCNDRHLPYSELLRSYQSTYRIRHSTT